MQDLKKIPESAQVLIVGGGPGGSYAATCLAREGLSVVLLEQTRFPRYHIGESMLASLRHFLRFIDLDDEFDRYGFTRKIGAAFKLSPQKREGYTDFTSRGENNYAWNVVRSEADDLLFRHAARCGAHVFDETEVIDIEFADYSNQKPVSALWKAKNGDVGKISFDWLVDASGRRGLISTKYLRNRRYNEGLKNIAHWGYWTGAGVYAPGTPRQGSPYFEALSDQSGWAWFIPLHNGTTSIGIVMDQKISAGKKGGNSVQAYYLRELGKAPVIQSLIHEGTLVSNGSITIHSASDYSYSASSYAGARFRIVGDAGAFIDPYFSSGVHLALASALSAAATICASVRGDCSETDAAEWHTARVGSSYTRFLFVVLSAYRQIRAQDRPVLSDVDEDNFDRVFNHFRPVIQGEFDTSAEKRPNKEDIETILNVCAYAYSEPTSPEERKEAYAHTSTLATDEALRALVKGDNGVETPRPLTGLSGDTKRVLSAIVARQVLRTEDAEHLGEFISDTFNGYQLLFQKGSLGLRKV